MNNGEIYDTLQNAQLHISKADKCRNDARHILSSITVLLRYDSTDWLKEKPKTAKRIYAKVGDLIRALRCEKEEAGMAEEIYIGYYKELNEEKEDVNG